MLLLSGVLLLCGAVIALVWAYEVNRRVPKPRWAQVELIWEVLLATAIGIVMIGLLLILKYVLQVHDLASLAPIELVASVAALAGTVALAWYMLRPLARLRLVEGGKASGRASSGGHDSGGRKPSGTGAAGRPARGVRKAA